MIVTCRNCKVEFDKPDRYLKRSVNHFCSRSCAAQFNGSKNQSFKNPSIMKECPEHGKVEHAVRANGKVVCRECAREYNRVFRQTRKKKIVEYGGGCCKVCGYDRCISALVFHHLDPNKKDFMISEKRRCNWETLVLELDKCVLLCNRCHEEVHDGLIELP